MYLVNKSNSDCSDTKKKGTNGENLFFVQASVRRNIYRFTLMEKLVGLPTMNAFLLSNCANNKAHNQLLALLFGTA